MPVSTRHQYWDRLQGQPPAPLVEFEVLDPFHQPDLNGELAGGKVYKKGAKQFVRLTPDQARFYLDSGSIAPVAAEAQPMSLKRAQVAAGMHGPQEEQK